MTSRSTRPAPVEIFPEEMRAYVVADRALIWYLQDHQGLDVATLKASAEVIELAMKAHDEEARVFQSLPFEEFLEDSFYIAGLLRHTDDDLV